MKIKNLPGATIFELSQAWLSYTDLAVYINDLLDDVCNIAIYADDTTLYSKCDQASELESDL